MTVDFKCEECGYVEEVMYDFNDGPPKEKICPDCGTQMYRVWGCAIKIPEHMKAITVGIDNDSMKEISNRMKHSRPSGRGKLFY